MKTLPHAQQVAVFDTAFHHQLPAKAYTYPIPHVFYKRHGIRRYGFHGMSHRYVSERAAVILDRPLTELKTVTCHLGSGNSAAAVKGGVSIDTSMGFTPLEGLVMGTRSGDLDPAIILTIMAREELSLHEASTLLNKHSGLQGISGISSDMKDILDACDENRTGAILALDVYCYRLKKYIASYAAAMGGLDVVVFTAGVGENAPRVREMATQEMEFLGIEVDHDKNFAAKNNEATDISTADAKVRSLVIPTNEELIIARDTKAIIEGELAENSAKG
jgi:acetate kinase